MSSIFPRSDAVDPRTSSDADVIDAEISEVPEPTEEGLHLMGLNALIGTKITNYDHEALGTVADVMLDPLHGRMAYAVMKSGGFLGLGEKRFAIPWGVLEFDAERKCLVLDADTATFANSPGFDPSQWSESKPADQSWQKKLHLHYKTRPYWD